LFDWAKLFCIPSYLALLDLFSVRPVNKYFADTDKQFLKDN